MKLALGTVQFGLDYGISNNLGKTKFNDVKKILNFSYLNGIDTLDTAPSYGNSEEKLSRIIRDEPDKKYQIISKTPKVNSDLDIQSQLSSSFDKTKSLFGSSFNTYLVHDANDYLTNAEVRLFLKNLKDTNQIDKIGVSVYEESEIRAIIEYEEVDILQVPINILDHRLIKSGILKTLKKNNIELHARSIFLQGLFFMKSKDIKKEFPTSVHSIEILNQVAKENDLEMHELALLFVYSLYELDKIIIGVNTKQQLVDNVKILSKEYNYSITEEILEKVNFIDEMVLNPKRWK